MCAGFLLHWILFSCISKKVYSLSCTEPQMHKRFSMFPLKARACRKQSCGQKQSIYMNQLSRVSFVQFGSLTYNQIKKNNSCFLVAKPHMLWYQCYKPENKVNFWNGLRVDRIAHVLSIELWNVFLWY